ncbi:MAG: MATE family efflux transporter [Methanobrevibacter sp.]|uniref:MATE family efflux transporter n=1 Tax=Methanobrevibacter sp. TaxID=66852 RepID=UPI003F04E4E0
MIPAIGVEAAILTISGYYFGAGNYKRIKSIYKYSIIFSTTISIISYYPIHFCKPNFILIHIIKWR